MSAVRQTLLILPFRKTQKSPDSCESGLSVSSVLCRSILLDLRRRFQLLTVGREILLPLTG